MGSSAATNRSVPVAKRWIVTNIVATNTGSTTDTLTVTLDGVKLVAAYQLLAGDIFTLDITQVIEQSGSLVVATQNDGVTAVHVSGVEQDVV